MTSAEGATIVGADTKICGEITGADNVVIEGEVEGAITVPGALVTISSAGRVRARIFAREIDIAGRLQGDALATEVVHLRASAMVLGDVTSARFVMEEEAMLRGHVDPVAASAPQDPGTVATGEGSPEPHVARLASTAEPREVGSLFAPHKADGIDAEEFLPAGLAAAARQVKEATATPVAEDSAPPGGVPRSASAES